MTAGQIRNDGAAWRPMFKTGRRYGLEESPMTLLNECKGPMAGFAESEARQFRRIFAVSVAVFVVVGAFARLLPRNWRPFGSAAGERRSLFEEAKAVANRFIPFAFMG